MIFAISWTWHFFVVHSNQISIRTIIWNIPSASFLYCSIFSNDHPGERGDGHILNQYLVHIPRYRSHHLFVTSFFVLSSALSNIFMVYDALCLLKFSIVRQRGFILQFLSPVCKRTYNWALLRGVGVIPRTPELSPIAFPSMKGPLKQSLARPDV